MNFLEEIKKSNKTFIIAEVGQNHQGEIQNAKELIKVAKESGADCVKFQKSCIPEKFTKSSLNVPYCGVKFGRTYGEHKYSLEFNEEDFIELQKYAKELNILFTASAMDPVSLDFLIGIGVPFIKIGSGDSNNFLLIEKAAKSRIPLIISTGMVEFDVVKDIYDLVSKYHKNFALLHCVSAYPTPYKDINLKVLNQFQKEFPDILVGYSGHEPGIHISVCGVAMGAKIIERHITLDKTQPGTDHKCSLEPQDLKTLVEQIRSLELALGEPNKKIQESEKPCYKKLGKCVVYAEDLPKGHIISLDDIKVKVSVNKGLDGTKYKYVLGKQLRCDVNKDDPVGDHFSICAIDKLAERASVISM